MRARIAKAFSSLILAISSCTGSVAFAQSTAGNQVTVHYIDVDQGAAALVEFPCGAIMIDAGGLGTRAHLLRYIDDFFARRTDLGHRFRSVFITHTHLDHNAYLLNVLDRYFVDALVENGRVNGEISKDVPARLAQKGIRHEIITESRVAAANRAGVTNRTIDPFDAGNCGGVDPEIRVLSGAQPRSSGAFSNENNHSLVIRVDYGASSFLWTGDLEEPGLELLVPRYAGTGMLDTIVYEAGHHGSHNATSRELLDAVSPRIAIISVGDARESGSKTAWAYGHPAKVIVEMLGRVVIASRDPVDGHVGTGQNNLFAHRESKAIYATGWDGDVRVVGDAQGHLSVQINDAPAQAIP
jgi:beta-lactamase superfamily II metal-dependent hydrolase